MPKISQSRIDAIKQSVSLLNWIEDEGHQPVKQGNDYVMPCVFHDDKTPSLKITLSKNLYHCFGCDAGGSIIDWVKQTKQVEFRQAVELIEQQTGHVVKSAAKIKTDKPILVTQDDDANQTVLNHVVESYHQSLLSNVNALAYLESRGLNNVELINTFKLGFSNKSLIASLGDRDSKQGRSQRKQLKAMGLINQHGYEHFGGCITVPVFSQGNCVELYGRKTQPYANDHHRYLPDAHRGVWNSEALTNTDTIILCESLIDAMTFWVNDYKNVTSSYGTNGFTAEHLAFIKKHNIKNILIAYDRDQAGEIGADKLAKLLQAENIHCYRVNFPKKMDANSYALQVTPAKKSLGLVIEKAVAMLDAPLLESINNTVSEEKPVKVQPEETTNTETATPSDTLFSLAAKEKTNETENKTTPLVIKDNSIHYQNGQRYYRVRGLENNTKTDQLKINLLLKTNDEDHYVDHLDLYQAKARSHYIKYASEELQLEPVIIKKDLAKLLLALEDHQEQQSKNNQDNDDKSKDVELTPEQHKQGLDLLTDANLMTRITTDIQNLGMVGEDHNALVSYLACVSRKLENPLAIMIQSTSAAGKSALMDSVLSLMPNNHQHKYAAMTGQSLYYMGQQNLQHSILAISEEEGAHNASYALKLLQSEGEVSIASTGKNEQTGDLETKTYKVQGPVMLMMTTTAIDIDEELMNRCLVLSVNETREQTKAIHQLQRQKRTLEGLQQKLQKQTIINQHHYAQQLIKPLAVINPYAKHLTFLSDKTRTRRDHEKYLTLIDSIALLHQHQREIKHINQGNEITEYIEVTIKDIEIANQLAHEVLGKSLDELPPQTRKLLDLVADFVGDECKRISMEQSDYRFSRKDIRNTTGWGNTQIRIHCDRLVEMEYLLVHRGRRGASFEYELLYQANQSENGKSVMKLIDTETLKNRDVEKTTRTKTPHKAGSKRPQNGAVTGSKRTEKKTRNNATNGIEDLSIEKGAIMHSTSKTNQTNNVSNLI